MRPATALHVAQPSATYEPRRPAQQVLHQIVLEHFETFRAQAAGLRDGEGLPRFVEQEFRDFLRCGGQAGGFARLRCSACGFDRLVPFSCYPQRETMKSPPLRVGYLWDPPRDSLQIVSGQ